MQKKQKGEEGSFSYLKALEKLRWITLGYHYDWTKNVYHDGDFTAFPTDLARVSSQLAKISGYPNDFEAEAAIVNFYAPDSFLGGHLDESEFYVEAPIVSMSFGDTGIFLLGTQSKDDPPIAMYARSGDVMIMGGSSRMCYHGVPRILGGTCPDFTKTEEKREGEGEGDPDVVEYLKTHRVNINVRQVLEQGKPFPQVNITTNT